MCNRPDKRPEEEKEMPCKERKEKVSQPSFEILSYIVYRSGRVLDIACPSQEDLVLPKYKTCALGMEITG